MLLFLEWLISSQARLFHNMLIRVNQYKTDVTQTIKKNFHTIIFTVHLLSPLIRGYFFRKFVFSFPTLNFFAIDYGVGNDDRRLL